MNESKAGGATVSTEEARNVKTVSISLLSITLMREKQDWELGLPHTSSRTSSGSFLPAAAPAFEDAASPAAFLGGIVRD